jgi:hypothetical protein
MVIAQDKGHSAVVLKAMGRAINKTVTIGAHLCAARCLLSLHGFFKLLQAVGCQHLG